MVESGLDVVRLNFSHGSHAEHLQSINLIRATEEKVGRPVGILMDLCGPKIRTTPLAPGVAPFRLERGSPLTIVSRKDVLSSPGTVGSIYTDLCKDLKPGQRVLLSDGLMDLIVDTVKGDIIECTVRNGGVLKGSQGINIPDSAVSARSVTEKDMRDLKFGLENGVDFVAVSFVKKAADLQIVRSAMSAAGVVRPLVTTSQ
jgi:pyruvate kinase